MEIEIISIENIKPSSPTPQNLRNYKFSLLDQIYPHVVFPTILFFPPPRDRNIIDTQKFISESTKALKQPLPKLLSRFYPFAGRLKDPFSIDCNDEGLLLTFAKTKSNLSDFLNKLDQKANLRLLPCQLGWSEPAPGAHVAMAQVSYFSCGGTAIGFASSHRVGDGVTVGSFLKLWSQYAAANYYGTSCNESVCPNYIASSFFPQRKDVKIEPDSTSFIMGHMKFGKTVMKRYVFDSRAISTLKSKTGGGNFRMSRAEVVTAFLWKCFIFATKKSTAGKLSLVTQTVNLRRRAQPPFPDNCFGNFLWMAIATNYANEENKEIESLVRKLKDSISKFDGDFVARMEGDDGLSGYYKNAEETWGSYPNKDVAELLSVTSWCNFGIFKIDFGWGNPIWINNCHGADDKEASYINTIWLNDTNKGDGVEAWVTLEEQYMKAFDDIEELRVLTTLNPSPFDI